MTQRFVLSDQAWTDLGITPLYIQLETTTPALWLASSSAPGSLSADAQVLASGDASAEELVTAPGSHVYARATSGTATVAVTPLAVTATAPTARIPKGFRPIPDLASSTGLGTIPTGATTALIVVERAGVRWRDDGIDPTATVGMPLEAGLVLDYDGPLGALRIIQTAAGASLSVTFYG